MKQALFLLSVPPPVHGASMMGKYLQDSKLINDCYSITYINLNTSLSVDEIGGQGFSKYFRIAGLFFRLLIQLIRVRPEFTYMTPTAGGMGFYKDWPLAMLCKLLSNKFIVHFHNKGVARFHDSGFDDWLYKRFFKNTEVIILAEELYPDVSKYVAADRVHICANGIPTSPLSSGNKPEKAPFTILFLSNLLIEKGLVDLLKALVLVKSAGIEVKCQIVGGEGDFSSAQLQEKIDSLGIADEAVYLGKKYGEEKDQLIRSADIFVFPTYYRKECFPLVILEAMSFGLPIITTGEGGIPSIIQDSINGLIVDSKNPEQLSVAIIKLFKEKDLRSTLGKKALEDFNQKFTVEKFEKNFLTTINRALVSK
ncbi:glycosyltransferase involved in cell wall biosynthesis [Algoriphagus sp. 4150]|uniref:glycosyltransferase family 4 protein n=1 Tax=Algoriphagus sp. 4150 TaxID=2817756 RepID=UPI0028570868|nr:glycosyltransferase family 4 protein [Algoriphagus sp. 4150]MDR7130549.1 glycosyltransferase involved in cell wall biosynthesis [Algoriphagus sp. 4150]